MQRGVLRRPMSGAMTPRRRSLTNFKEEKTNDEARATNDEQHEPAWRQLDDVLTTAAPFDCGGFGQVRASPRTQPAATFSAAMSAAKADGWAN